MQQWVDFFPTVITNCTQECRRGSQQAAWKTSPRLCGLWVPRGTPDLGCYFKLGGVGKTSHISRILWPCKNALIKYQPERRLGWQSTWLAGTEPWVWSRALCKTHVVAHACSLSNWHVEARGSGVQSYIKLHIRVEASLSYTSLCFQKTNKQNSWA